MVRGKRIREKGKKRLSEYFKELKEGERVAIKIERSVEQNFPKKLQGRCGVVMGSRGRFKIVELKENSKPKIFIIHPAHLRRIK